MRYCATSTKPTTQALFLTKTKMEIEHNIDMLIAYLDNIEETTYLIIDASGLKVEENTPLFKKLKQKAEVSETKELSQVEMILLLFLVYFVNQ